VLTTIGAVEVGAGVGTTCTRDGLGTGVLTAIGAVEVGADVGTTCARDGLGVGPVMTTDRSGVAETTLFRIAVPAPSEEPGLTAVSEGLEVTIGDGGERPKRIRLNITRPNITAPLKIAALRSIDFLFGGGVGGGESGAGGGDRAAGDPVQPDTHPSVTGPSLSVSQNSWQFL
jgi:hypothetical protein